MPPAVLVDLGFEAARHPRRVAVVVALQIGQGAPGAPQVHEPVIIVGQILASLICVRNIMLIFKDRRAGAAA